jgi:hypothetical protein
MTQKFFKSLLNLVTFNDGPGYVSYYHYIVGSTPTADQQPSDRLLVAAFEDVDAADSGLRTRRDRIAREVVMQCEACRPFYAAAKARQSMLA